MAATPQRPVTCGICMHLNAPGVEECVVCGNAALKPPTLPALPHHAPPQLQLPGQASSDRSLQPLVASFRALTTQASEHSLGLSVATETPPQQHSQRPSPPSSIVLDMLRESGVMDGECEAKPGYGDKGSVQGVSPHTVHSALSSVVSDHFLSSGASGAVPSPASGSTFTSGGSSSARETPSPIPRRRIQRETGFPGQLTSIWAATPGERPSMERASVTGRVVAPAALPTIGGAGYAAGHDQDRSTTTAWGGPPRVLHTNSLERSVFVGGLNPDYADRFPEVVLAICTGVHSFEQSRKGTFAYVTFHTHAEAASGLQALRDGRRGRWGRVEFDTRDPTSRGRPTLLIRPAANTVASPQSLSPMPPTPLQTARLAPVSRSATADSTLNRKLVLAGIPGRMNSSFVGSAIASDAPGLKTVKMPRDVRDCHFGFAVLSFATHDHAVMALQSLNGKQIADEAGKARMSCRWDPRGLSDAQSPPRAPSAGISYADVVSSSSKARAALVEDPTEVDLYVTVIPMRVTDESLREWISGTAGCSGVVNVVTRRNPHGGCSGSAVVTFADHHSAAAARKRLHGAPMGPKILRAAWNSRRWEAETPPPGADARRHTLISSPAAASCGGSRGTPMRPSSDARWRDLAAATPPSSASKAPAERRR